MHQPPKGLHPVDSNIKINGDVLNCVDKFTYPLSLITIDATTTEEVQHRIQAASSAYGRLKSRVYYYKDLTKFTEIMCQFPQLEVFILC